MHHNNHHNPNNPCERPKRRFVVIRWTALRQVHIQLAIRGGEGGRRARNCLSITRKTILATRERGEGSPAARDCLSIIRKQCILWWFGVRGVYFESELSAFSGRSASGALILKVIYYILWRFGVRGCDFESDCSAFSSRPALGALILKAICLHSLVVQRSGR